MKKKLIFLGIHLTVVALVLILTMVTLAWYTKSETGEASNAVIVAEPLNNVSITDIVDNIIPYKGQTGLGGADAPYIATKILSISQESKNAGDAVTCILANVSVTLPNETQITTNTEGYEDLLNSFTLRVKVVELDGDNNVTNVKGIFYPDANDVLVDSEQNKLLFQDETYFSVTESNASANAKTCSTYIQLELIFLDEASYTNATTPGNAGTITPFRFSSYDYMGSTFSARFALGMEEGSNVAGDEQPIEP